jgi:hypothetical protein
MSRTTFFITVAMVIVVALISANFQGTAVYAQGTPAATEEACNPQNPNPVAKRLAKALTVPEPEIMDWHCQKHGFGEIRKAYVLEKLTSTGGEMTPLTVTQIFSMRAEGKGWGPIVKSTGLTMKEFNKSVQQLMKAEKKADKVKGKDKAQKKDKGKGKGNSGDKDDDERDDDDD